MVSFSTSDERLDKIDSFIKNGHTSDRSTFINQSIDFYFRSLESKKIIDFMYLISIPFLFFLTTIGITLFFASLFFYIVSTVSGIYLIIFFYLFYNRYRGVK